MRLVGLLVILAATGLLSACGGGGVASGASLAGRSAAQLGAGAAVGTLAEGFRACGATQTPPASVLTTSASDLPPVVNRSAGDLDDSTAGQWAAAFWREQAIE